MNWKVVSVLLLLLGSCTQQILLDSDETLREQAFIQDLLEDNSRLRSQNEVLEALVNRSQLQEQVPDSKTMELLEQYHGLELPNPRERIPVEAINVEKTGLFINRSGIFPGRIADTNSMDPVFDADSKVLVIRPKDERDIILGDIVVYSCDECNNNKIIHRVVGVGRDLGGSFYLLKGDNSPRVDPYRIRFSQIEWVVVGIIY